MKTKILIAAIIGALMLLILPAAADYSGDHPLVLVESGTINGDVLYLVEDDTIGNYLKLTDFPLGNKPSVTQTFTVSIPDGAEVTSAKLYNYYTWSKVEGDKYTPGAPAEADITFSSDTSAMNVNLINPEGCDVTSCDNPFVYPGIPNIIHYWDSKSTTSGVAWNTPYGNIVIDVTDMVSESGTYTATIEHASNGNTISFATYGFALLIVYEDDTASPISYWITEGADALWSSSYYTGFTPDECTTEVLNPVGFDKGWHNMKILAAGTNKPFKDSQQTKTEILLDGNKIQTFPFVSSYALSLYDKDVHLKNQYDNIFSVRDKGDLYTVFNAILVDR